MHYTTAKIVLDGSDYQINFGINSSVVDVIASDASDIMNSDKTASSCLMLAPRVRYNWDYKYHSTNILATHPELGYSAWFIRGAEGKPFIRLMHEESLQKSLLKNFGGDSLTLGFSSFYSPIMAVLDFHGTLSIFQINFPASENKLSMTINLNDSGRSPSHVDLKWAPSVPMPFEHKETSLLLAVALDGIVRLIDLNGLIEQNSGPLTYEEVSASYNKCPRLLDKMVLQVASFPCNVEAMEFSADASTLFVAAKNGRLYSFALADIKNGNLSPRCEWSPPNESSICSLHHVDFKSPEAPEGYLVGVNNYHELKLWRLPDFSTAQVITFCPNEPPGEISGTKNNPPPPQPMLVTRFDPKSGILVASDIKRTVLYTLHLCRDPARPHEVRFQCVSEFLLVAPCIAIDLGLVTRSLSLQQPLSAYDPKDRDQIEIVLSLILSNELKAAKLTYSVPIEIYMDNSAEKTTTVPLSTAAETCDSPVLSEAASTALVDKLQDANFLSAMQKRPNSVSGSPQSAQWLTSVSPPRGVSASGDNPLSAPPPSEAEAMKPSIGLAAPLGTSETDSDGGPIGNHSSQMRKAFESVPGNMNAGNEFWRQSTCSPHASDASPQGSTTSGNPAQMAYAGEGNTNRPAEMSDSVRSLVGSSSAVSLSNSPLRDPSTTDLLSGASNDIFTHAMGLSMKVHQQQHQQTESMRSVDGDSTDAGRSVCVSALETSAATPIRANVVPLQSSSSNGDAVGQGETVQLLKTLLEESRAQAGAIRALMTKVQENREELTKLAGVQTAMLGSKGAAPHGAADMPPWAVQMIKYMDKQKVEASRQMVQLESSVKNLQLLLNQAPLPAPADITSNRQVQALIDQLRVTLVNEMHNVFQAHDAKVFDTLRQQVATSLDAQVTALRHLISDKMVATTADPKYVECFANTVTAAVSPSLTAAYREEIQRVYAPALASSVEKLGNDLNGLLKEAFEKHIQAVTVRIESGVQSAIARVDDSSRRFEELSKELTSKMANLKKELAGLQNAQQPTYHPQTNAMPVAGKVQKPSTPAMASNNVKPMPPQQQQQLGKNAMGPAGMEAPASEAYQTIQSLIQNKQYVEALKLAVTTNTQGTLLNVLRELPVVPLFRQNIGQEVLLTLINQLSCGDLKDQFDLKISYLDEAVNHLRADETTLQYGPKLLNMLKSKLELLCGQRSGSRNPGETNRVNGLLRSICEKLVLFGHGP